MQHGTFLWEDPLRKENLARAPQLPGPVGNPGLARPRAQRPPKPPRPQQVAFQAGSARLPSSAPRAGLGWAFPQHRNPMTTAFQTGFPEIHFQIFKKQEPLELNHQITSSGHLSEKNTFLKKPSGNRLAELFKVKTLSLS